MGFAALAAARWIHFAALMLLFGAALFPLYALPTQRVPPELARVRSVLRVAAVVALLSGIAWASASLVNITGEVGSLFDRDSLGAFFFETGFGKIWGLRLALLLALLVATFSARADLRARNAATALVVFLAALLLISQAWIGHPAASPASERPIIITGYALHVLGAGAWLGGLLPLCLILHVRNSYDPSVAIALHRFSAAGMLAIAIILAGGLINAWARWNSLDALVASTWGKVLIVKALSFIALVALASVNRFILMPRLAGHTSARTALLGNAVAEQAVAVPILAAAAVLGILPPPA